MAVCEGFQSHIPLPSPYFCYILLTFSKKSDDSSDLKKEEEENKNASR